MSKKMPKKMQALGGLMETKTKKGRGKFNKMVKCSNIYEKIELTKRVIHNKRY